MILPTSVATSATLHWRALVDRAAVNEVTTIHCWIDRVTVGQTEDKFLVMKSMHPLLDDDFKGSHEDGKARKRLTHALRVSLKSVCRSPDGGFGFDNMVDQIISPSGDEGIVIICFWDHSTDHAC